MLSFLNGKSYNQKGKVTIFFNYYIIWNFNNITLPLPGVFCKLSLHFSKPAFSFPLGLEKEQNHVF